MKEMEELLPKLLWSQLQSIGIFREKEPVITEFKREINQWYNKWFEESLAFLGRQNYLHYDGKLWSVTDPAPTDIDDLWQEWNSKKVKWLEDPNMRAQVVLVEETLRRLPEILTGKVQATDIMFPNSSMELIEGIYQQNLIADHFNEVLANIVVLFVQERLKQDGTAQIRIIEIGAGTGGTSTMIFPKLRPYQAHIQEYCYTDISKAFLMHAEKEYGPENPYLAYQIFNVEAPLAGQGITVGGYDLAIAANVLYVTKDIRQTLRNAKATLKNHGLLLLNEISGNSLLAHLTFGLLEEWWLHEDSELRIPGCPGLYPQTWQKVLESVGFQSVFFPAQTAQHWGQQIIVAESDGIVRQNLSIKPKVTFVKKSNNILAPDLVQAMERELPKKPERLLATASPVQSKHAQGLIFPVKPEQLKEKTIYQLKILFGNVIKLSIAKFDTNEPFENYGIDSIIISQLNHKLADIFGQVSATLFYEYQTLGALGEYLIAEYPQECLKWTGLEIQVQSVPEMSLTMLDFDHEFPVLTPMKLRTKQTRSLRVKASSGEIGEPIAIIGMSGRFPQAETLVDYWENLKAGKCCITEIPEERWPLEGFYHPNKQEAIAQGKSYSKWGGFIEGYADFDPLFFNISPREASNMDPQGLLLLEECWKALEDAGCSTSNLSPETRQRIGVFCGITQQEFYPSTSFSAIVNRVSYYFNLQGPSIPVDTMCSSSLVAIHQGCEYIRHGKGDLAIVGGVNLYLHPYTYIKLSMNRFISSTSNSAAFGKDGIGFVPGEGVGVIVLKAYDQAIKDCDNIYAIIRGTAVNHNGKTNSYLTPNPNQQAAVIQQALEQNNIDPRTISYIESAASGSEMGDAIEMTALTKVFSRRDEARRNL